MSGETACVPTASYVANYSDRTAGDLSNQVFALIRAFKRFWAGRRPNAGFVTYCIDKLNCSYDFAYAQQRSAAGVLGFGMSPPRAPGGSSFASNCMVAYAEAHAANSGSCPQSTADRKCWRLVPGENRQASKQRALSAARDPKCHKIRAIDLWRAQQGSVSVTIDGVL